VRNFSYFAIWINQIKRRIKGKTNVEKEGIEFYVKEQSN